jgi:hypothetical protein
MIILYDALIGTHRLNFERAETKQAELDNNGQTIWHWDQQHVRKVSRIVVDRQNSLFEKKKKDSHNGSSNRSSQINLRRREMGYDYHVLLDQSTSSGPTFWRANRMIRGALK